MTSSPKTKNDYIKLSNETIAHCIDFIQSDGWNLTEKPYPNSNITCTKIQKRISKGNNSMEDILRILYNPSFDERKYLHNEIISYSKIETITNNIEVVHSEFGISSLTANREFLVMKSFEELDEGGYIICTKSITRDDVDMPQKPMNVVASAISCNVIEITENPNEILITNMIHIEPNGWIPPMVVNTFKANSMQWLNNLQSLLLNQ